MVSNIPVTTLSLYRCSSLESPEFKRSITVKPRALIVLGASQADAAILVVNSTVGEFETGFENGGQTREHAMLLRSLGNFCFLKVIYKVFVFFFLPLEELFMPVIGVGQLVVAINKLDTVDWSQERFNEVEAAIKSFLTKQVLPITLSFFLHVFSFSFCN